MINRYNPLKLKVLYMGLIIMSICEVFFIFDVIEDITDLRIPLLEVFNHSVIEAITTISLGVAIFILIDNIKALLKHQQHIEDSLNAASGELHKVIEEYFIQWKLSTSEKEVALLLFKGYSGQEIADLRDTKLGTVKNQSSAIYQKAQVKNRDCKNNCVNGILLNLNKGTTNAYLRQTYRPVT